MTIKLLFILSFLYLLILVAYVRGFIPNYASTYTDKESVLGDSSKIIDTKNKLELTFFDVGQGDSIYIKTPNDERLLIDGGASYDVDYKISKKFVYPFCYFDNIFLTHPHLDHYGGLKKVTQRCDFGNFTFNDIQCKSNSCKYFSGISTNNSILIGDKFSFKDVTIKVLWPDIKNNNVDYSNVNNLSVVMFLDYGDFEAILTGDAELEALNQIDLSEVTPLIQNGLDVFKISHHGAKNGLSFRLLEQLKPHNCVISVGKDNKYGHPNKEVLEYLSLIKCNVLRTDEIGDITFLW